MKGVDTAAVCVTPSPLATRQLKGLHGVLASGASQATEPAQGGKRGGKKGGGGGAAAGGAAGGLVAAGGAAGKTSAAKAFVLDVGGVGVGYGLKVRRGPGGHLGPRS